MTANSSAVLEGVLRADDTIELASHPALPPGPVRVRSLIDLHQLHTIRLDLLGALNLAGKRLCRLATPYREHLAQHFATTYSRIGLPEPYETQAD